MVVDYQPTSDLAVNFADNLCRWDRGATPHYEVWFLTLNHRASQRGFWFRYTLHSPVGTADGRKPAAALWAAAFSRGAPDQNLGLTQEYLIDDFRFEGREAFNLCIGGGGLSASHATGMVQNGGNSIRWDLSFEPCDATYHHIPRTLAQLARPSSSLCSPNLDTRFSGTIEVNGERLVLDREPGCQSHLWGRKHVDEWVWVHSNAFEKTPGTVFEGLAAQPRRVGKKLPPIQSLYLRHRGEEHRFVRLRLAEQWKSRLGMGYWSFSAMITRIYIEGVA